MAFNAMTMLDVVEVGEKHESDSFRQYAKQLLRVMKWRGYDRPDLSGLTGDVKTWLSFAPEYDSHDATLLRDLPWKKGTYQQYQKCGRLLIEHVTGAFAERAARKATCDDSWATLAERAEALAAAGLFSSQRLAGLARITDVARAAGLQSADITNERVVDLKARTNSAKEWDGVKRGATLLDDLRAYPTLLPLLPARPIGRIETRWRRPFDGPNSVRPDLDRWLEDATTIYPKDVESEALRRAMAQPLSEGASGIYTAALGNYLDVLGTKRDLTGARLADLFGAEDLIAVLFAWIENSSRPGGLKPGSMYQYLNAIRLTLQRNGEVDAARRIQSMLNAQPILRQGKAARERMSPDNEAWCRDLLVDERRIEIFETQHILYAQRAKATLDEAAAEGLDLVALASDPEAMSRLSARKRGRAKKLIVRARRFGTCAAYRSN